MRYPQFFATLAIEKKLDQGAKHGIIWHTQGSGKTALAFHNVRYLRDYYQKQGNDSAVALGRLGPAGSIDTVIPGVCFIVFAFVHREILGSNGMVNDRLCVYSRNAEFIMHNA